MCGLRGWERERESERRGRGMDSRGGQGCSYVHMPRGALAPKARRSRHFFSAATAAAADVAARGWMCGDWGETAPI